MTFKSQSRSSEKIQRSANVAVQKITRLSVTVPWLKFIPVFLISRYRKYCLKMAIFSYPPVFNAAVEVSRKTILSRWLV